MLHFSDSDLLLELLKRVYDINDWLEQRRRQELKEAKVVSIDVGRAGK